MKLLMTYIFLSTLFSQTFFLSCDRTSFIPIQNNR